MAMLFLWLVLLILFISVEAATLGLTTIWFAGGSLAAIIAALLGTPVFVQVILFLIVSLALLFFTRPVAVKYFNRERVRTNVESLVGKQGVVLSEIDNLKEQGQITVGGQEWSARSMENMRISAGTVVEVVSVSGVKLFVRCSEKTGAEAAGPDAGRQEGRTD